MNWFAGPITVQGHAVIGSLSGSLTLGGDINSQGEGFDLTGAGAIVVTGKISLGTFGNLTDSASGQDTISGVISGLTAGSIVGLTGAYYNLPATQDLIEPANASNPSWLGNQTPSVTARLIGPIDFPDIADNGFADSVGDPAYYNIGGGNNNVEARWYGDILIPGSGTAAVPIDFATTSDDGSMLYIDGNAVVYNNNFQGATQATGLVDLTPGLHTIDIEYYQGNGGATMDAQWDPSGGTNFVDIPVSAFPQPVNGLTKTGAGTLTLSNVDTFSGATTIKLGKLVVNGRLVNSTILVNSDGTLAGDGKVAATTVQDGGTLSPGNSPGTLTVASLSLAPGSTFKEELGGTAVGGQYDQTIVAAGGTVALSGATLSLSFLGGFRPTVGQHFTIINNQSGGSVVGTFSQGSEFAFDSYTFGLSYSGGGRHDVVLTVLSEDVTSQVKVSKSGLVYNRATQLFGGTVTITNMGSTALIDTLQFEVTGLPAGVTLANASGTAPDGNPYIAISLGTSTLAPGQSITFNVLFKNPKLLSFTYGLLVTDEIASA